MIDSPEIVTVPAQTVAMIPLKVPSKDIMTIMGPGITEVHSVLAAQGITPAGAWLTHHHRVPTDTFDFEICVPVTTAVEPAGRVIPGELRAARIARTVYHGGYEGLGNGWGEFMKWLETQGLNTADDLWEIYQTGPESGPDSSNYRTILNKPLKD